MIITSLSKVQEEDLFKKPMKLAKKTLGQGKKK